MPIQTTYTHARANLAKLMDKVTQDQEIVIVSRRGGGDVALISAEELSSMLETAHLLRSPRNARRLLDALERSREGMGKPTTVAELRREFGLVEKA